MPQPKFEIDEANRKPGELGKPKKPESYLFPRATEPIDGRKFTLYQDENSIWGNMAIDYLNAKKVKFDIYWIHLMRWDHMVPEMVEYNPETTVPFLKVEEPSGKVYYIRESTGILEWLENEYPEPKLVYDDPLFAKISKMINGPPINMTIKIALQLLQERGIVSDAAVKQSFLVICRYAVENPHLAYCYFDKILRGQEDWVLSDTAKTIKEVKMPLFKKQLGEEYDVLEKQLIDNGDNGCLWGDQFTQLDILMHNVIRQTPWLELEYIPSARPRVKTFADQNNSWVENGPPVWDTVTPNYKGERVKPLTCYVAVRMFMCFAYFVGRAICLMILQEISTHKVHFGCGLALFVAVLAYFFGLIA